MPAEWPLGPRWRTLVPKTLLVLALTLIGLLVGVVLASRSPTVFNSTAQIYVGVASGGSAGELSQGNIYVKDQMKSYAVLATSPSTLEPVIAVMNLDMTVSDLAKKIVVTSEPNTTILSITARDTDPGKATILADGLARELSQRILEIAPKADDGRELISVTSISQAISLNDPNGMTSSLPAIGAIIGLAVGATLASLGYVRQGLLARIPRRAHEI